MNHIFCGIIVNLLSGQVRGTITANDRHLVNEDCWPIVLLEWIDSVSWTLAVINATVT